MGIVRNGFYTRGYKTTEQIYDMTGMRYGDTVFDTTRDERLVYDGDVWVTGSMIGKSFSNTATTVGSITYLDTAKCGQMVGYQTSYASGLQVKSTGGAFGGNVENAIGHMQFPVGRSYGSAAVPAALQYSGHAYVWADSTGNFVGQYVMLATNVNGGVPGNYYSWVGRNKKEVTPGIAQVGCWSIAPTNIIVSSTDGGFTGTIPIGKAFIRFGETN